MDHQLQQNLIMSGLLWPLLRIILLVSFGLVVANIIESLNWSHRLAVISRPLTRFGHLSEIAGASFSMAFFSGVSANSMLAESYDQKLLSKSELVLANLFNSLPRFFLHLPTVFFLTAPLIKGAAFIYVGLTFAAALLQTMLIVGLGHLLLPPAKFVTSESSSTALEKTNWRNVFKKSIKRLKKRMPKLLIFTIPVYIFFFLLSHYGYFDQLEKFIAEKAWFLAWLQPKSLAIVILHVTSEFSAGLAAAGALLADQSLGYRDVVLALLVGNILAAPMRAVRHQFPYYVGIFSARLAMQLIAVSQICRLTCVCLVGTLYYLLTV